MAEWSEPFIGSEALKHGVLDRSQLRTRYRIELPDVYVPKHAVLSFDQRIAAAWLWSRREATIAGVAAAALYGAEWIDDDTPVELIHANARAPQGVITRRDELFGDETQRLGGYRVTTPERAAFDIGRRGNVAAAVARLDALVRAAGVKIADAAELARRHRGVRGLRQLETVLDLVDGGAQSPKETWLRLALIRAGLPRPRTQIPVFGVDGNLVAYLDMGWERLKVAVEYDGDHHRLDRGQYVKDIRRLEMLDQLGWVIVRVVAEDRARDVVRRVRRAIHDRTVGCAVTVSGVR